MGRCALGALRPDAIAHNAGVSPRRILRGALERVETGFDAAFTPSLNPFYQLGALAWFLYWIVAATGIYLYVFFDTGIEDAYASVDRITHVQWYAGGVMRSLHRYASDALVLVVLIHLLREYLLDRMRGARWLAWCTGVPLLWLLFAAGVSGYWVVWDELAQYVAIASSEWLDALGLFGEPIARNFLHPSTLSSRFFTLLVYIHIFVPLAMLFLMWIHLQSLSRPRVNPPRGLALGTLAMLLAVSIARPALSHPPADLARVPGPVELDWLYLFPLPLQDHMPGAALWGAVAALTLLLFAVPLLPPLRRTPAAKVVDQIDEFEVLVIHSCNAQCILCLPREKSLSRILARTRKRLRHIHQCPRRPSVRRENEASCACGLPDERPKECLFIDRSPDCPRSGLSRLAGSLQSKCSGAIHGASSTVSPIPSGGLQRSSPRARG